MEIRTLCEVPFLLENQLPFLEKHDIIKNDKGNVRPAFNRPGKSPQPWKPALCAKGCP